MPKSVSTRVQTHTSALSPRSLSFHRRKLCYSLFLTGDNELLHNVSRRIIRIVPDEFSIADYLIFLSFFFCVKIISTI